MKKAVILMSGGLDSVVAGGFPQVEYKIELALTFDYGQKAVLNEIKAASDICKYYKYFMGNNKYIPWKTYIYFSDDIFGIILV